MKKNDIRMFLKRRDKEGKDPVLLTDTRAPSRIEDQPKESKMNMIRRKMTESRRKKEQQEGNIAIVKKHPETYKGQKLIAARDLEKGAAQDILEVVVVGADVAALYPSLSDLEVGIICHDAVMNTNIKFKNYKIAAKFVSIHLSETEARLSPLFPILPRRTSRQGVRPGVTSNPDNESSWWYPTTLKSLLSCRGGCYWPR